MGAGGEFAGFIHGSNFYGIGTVSHQAIERDGGIPNRRYVPFDPVYIQVIGSGILYESPGDVGGVMGDILDRDSFHGRGIYGEGIGFADGRNRQRA